MCWDPVTCVNCKCASRNLTPTVENTQRTHSYNESTPGVSTRLPRQHQSTHGVSGGVGKDKEQTPKQCVHWHARPELKAHEAPSWLEHTEGFTQSKLKAAGTAHGDAGELCHVLRWHGHVATLAWTLALHHTRLNHPHPPQPPHEREHTLTSVTLRMPNVMV